MNNIFKIKGKSPLQGEVEISGSKNAALPILAASLIISGKSKIKNVPLISDVKNFLNILSFLGVKIDQKGNDIKLNSNSLKSIIDINHEGIEKMRAAILLLGPLLARIGEVKIPFPGGCVLGKRSIFSHLFAFEQIGIEVLESKRFIHLKQGKNFLKTNKIILPEMSVTATENILIFLSFFEKEVEVRMCASEPHVQNLCQFLKNSGAKISGIGSSTIKIKGGNLKNGQITVTPDMLEVGTFIIASSITNGNVLIKNVDHDHLDSFYQKLNEVGVNFTLKPKAIKVTPSNKFKAVDFKTAVFPGFSTDLMAPFVVLLTQAKGVSRVFETLFEGRFAFLIELEKMGARSEILNPHNAIIIGKTPLKGSYVASQDIRAGAAVTLAALAAKGESKISNINYIFRGYENFTEKLQSLGADIYIDT